MRKVITRLTAKHEDAFFHASTYSGLALMLDNEWDLCIRITPATVRVGQQADPDGFVAGADITFATARGEWVPISRSVMLESTWPSNLRFGKASRLRMTPEGELHFALPVGRNLMAWRHGRADTFHPMPGMEGTQARTALFCEAWAQKLESQGWLERAVRA